jgi:hypothetical protein
MIGRHGINKAMQVDAARVQYYYSGSRIGTWTEEVHYDRSYACTFGSMVGTYRGSRGSYRQFRCRKKLICACNSQTRNRPPLFLTFLGRGTGSDMLLGLRSRFSARQHLEIELLYNFTVEFR